MRRSRFLGCLLLRLLVAVLSIGAVTLAAGIPAVTASVFTSQASLWKVDTVQPLPSGENTAFGPFPYDPTVFIGVNDQSFHGVSCVSSSFCVMVGSAFFPPNPNTGQQGVYAVVETYNGSKWSLVSIPEPSGVSSSDYNGLDGVSCISTTFCVAVGTTYGSIALTSKPSFVDTLIEVYNGSSWSVLSSPDVGGTNSYLNGVSCVTTTFCVAVGFSGRVANFKPIIEVYNGRVWAMTTGPVQAGSSQLFSVSCVSVTFCAAVGINENAAGIEPMMETYNGRDWSLTPAQGTPSGYELFSVSCTSTTFCVAVGYNENPSIGFQSVIEVYKGCSWEVASTPNVMGLLRNYLFGVSCASSTSCVADGWLQPEGSFIETYNGNAWSVEPVTSFAKTKNPGYTVGVSCPSVSFCVLSGVAGGTGANANASEPFAMQASGDVTGSPVVPPPGGTGYYETAADGGIFSFGAAHYYGSMGGKPLNAPIVAMATTFHGLGYWLGAADGGVFAYGNAGFFGSMGGRHLNKPVVGMSPTPGQQGYWLVASDGGIFSFGDAVFHGSMGGRPLKAPVEAMSSDYCTGGYWLVASDGGMFSFYAPFYGSMGGRHLNAPIAAMAPTPDGKGYWLVASDGGVFAFGDARFYGSMGGRHLNAPIVGIATTPNGKGYWLVASDGGVFAFGDARFFGSMGGHTLDAPVFSMAPTP